MNIQLVASLVYEVGELVNEHCENEYENDKKGIKFDPLSQCALELYLFSNTLCS